MKDKILNIKLVYSDRAEPTEKFVGSPDKVRKLAKDYIDRMIDSNDDNLSGIFIRVVK